MNENKLKELIDDAINDAWEHNDLLPNIQTRLYCELHELTNHNTKPLVSDSLLSDNRWNFVQKFKESDEYKRLTTELDIEEDRVIITAGKIYDYLTSNDR